jgi:predicted nucleic acid-binding protein
MAAARALLDSDTVSELSRGNAKVSERAAAYLLEHGRLTISSITVFERLRGYRVAIGAGKPFDEHLRQFQAFVATCRVLPVDTAVASHAALIWAGVSARARRALGDILIGATASAHGLPLATRNGRDFEPMTRVAGVRLALTDWTH